MIITPIMTRSKKNYIQVVSLSFEEEIGVLHSAKFPGRFVPVGRLSLIELSFFFFIIFNSIN